MILLTGEFLNYGTAELSFCDTASTDGAQLPRRRPAEGATPGVMIGPWTAAAGQARDHMRVERNEFGVSPVSLRNAAAR